MSLERQLLLDHLDFQVIKVNGFDKMILGKADLAVKLEFTHRGVQPHGLFQVKFVADLIQGLKDHLSPGKGVVADGNDGVLNQMIMLDDFSANIGKLGLKLFACVVDKDAQSIIDVRFQDGCAVIIGNEANGVTAETKKASDLLITIPMQGAAESLNAAAAAAISIWEMMKI